jgi:hypothetical protein
MGADPFHVEGVSVFIQAAAGNPLEELVALVDLENQQTVTAVLQVIADPGFGDVKKPAFIRGCLCRRRVKAQQHKSNESGDGADKRSHGVA